MKTITQQTGRGDSLGNRMKGYEQASRIVLPRRMPVILRIDGRAFHTLTRKCQRPFDTQLMEMMDATAIHLCEEIAGAVFGYVQSDEISILVHTYKRLSTQPWFDNQLQKIVSVSASIAGAYFTPMFEHTATFDARAFVLPEAEVCNYFLWRQQDATRNSLQMLARAHFSHRDLDGRNTNEMHAMLADRGIQWNNLPEGCKRGRAIVYRMNSSPSELVIGGTWKSEEPPVFSEDREYINKHLAVEDES